MKRALILTMVFTPFFLSSTCKKDVYRNAEPVRLNAIISDTAETIALGDTLKVEFNVPATFFTESAKQVYVRNLQKGSYVLSCYRIDTINKRLEYLNNSSAFFVTQGTNVGGTIYVSNNGFPYKSILNIVPVNRGVYVLEILAQPGQLNVNIEEYYGLKINFNILDKHWSLIAYYYSVYSNTNYNTFMSQLQQINNDGYGYYGFRVN